jgi:DNA-binding transcriptional LysR family regulator
MPVAAPAPDGTPAHAMPGTAGQPVPYLEFDDSSGMGRILRASCVIPSDAAWLRPVFRSHMATALLSMARHGRGVCWAPHSLAAADLARGLLVCAGDSTWHVPIEIRICKPVARRNQQVEALWAMLRRDAAAAA